MNVPVRPTPSLSGGREGGGGGGGGRGGGGSSQLTLRMYVRLCWTDLQRTAMARLPELICALVIISSISTTEPLEAGLPCSRQPDMSN